MRFLLLLFGLFALGGCVLVDLDENMPQVTVPDTALSPSCRELWRNYVEQVQLITDDDMNWSAHDDHATQLMTQFSGSCDAAGTREDSARELRCKALWDIYVKQVARMTKDDLNWRKHDAQQNDALARIRVNCAKTACTYLPNIRCTVPNTPS